jgi:hypothetical protein
MIVLAFKAGRDYGDREGCLAGTRPNLGVRRISVGSGLAAVAPGVFMRAARSIATTGQFDNAFAHAVPFAEINEVFSKGN